MVNQLHAQGGNFVICMAMDLLRPRAQILGYSLARGNRWIKHQKHELQVVEGHVLQVNHQLNFLAVVHDGDTNAVSFKC